MKSKSIKLIFIPIVLLGIALAIPRAQQTLIASAEAYRPPAEFSASPVTDAPPAQSRRVVLVILSGLSDYFWTDADMPTLQQLQNTGAQTEIISQPPSYRLPAWVALLGGTSPALTDAPLFDVFDALTRQTATDTILAAAAEQSRRVAIAGNRRWADILPADIAAETAFFPATAADADAQVMAQVAQWVDDPSISLIVAQFSRIDAAAATGVDTDDYQTALKMVDRQLEQLRKMLDLSATTLIITADYGHLAQGGHGGDDPEVVTLPLIMVGQGVSPGKYSPAAQRDIAPTIAALLGTRFPSANTGTPLLEMLALSPADSAAVWMSLAQQRVSLAENYITAIGGTFSPPENLKKLKQFYQDGNFSGTAQLAKLIVSQADAAIQTAINARLRSERRPRMAIASAILLLVVAGVLWRRSILWAEAGIAAGVTVVVYHGLYRALKLPYSLSVIENLPAFEQTLIGLIAAAVFAGMLVLAVLALLRRQTFTWQEMMLSGYEVTWWAVVGFGVTVLSGFWRVGATVDWIFPDVGVLFSYLTSLWQVRWTAIIGVVLPPIMAGLYIGIQYLYLKHQQKKVAQATKNTEGNA